MLPERACLAEGLPEASDTNRQPHSVKPSQVTQAEDGVAAGAGGRSVRVALLAVPAPPSCSLGDPARSLADAAGQLGGRPSGPAEGLVTQVLCGVEALDPCREHRVPRLRRRVRPPPGLHRLPTAL